MVIVAAIDDSDRASTVVGEAATLADRFDDELHVLHVLKRSKLSRIRGVDVETEPSVENFEVQEYLSALESRACDARSLGDDYTFEARAGHPADEIDEYLAETDARYVVIGSRRRSPTGKALFGSVTQALILHADRPVVSVAEPRS